MEELIQGFAGWISVIETSVAEYLKSFLEQYRGTLDTITARLETANKRYDDQKIQEQIDELKDVVATVPKVIRVKNSLARSHKITDLYSTRFARKERTDKNGIQNHQVRTIRQLIPRKDICYGHRC